MGRDDGGAGREGRGPAPAQRRRPVRAGPRAQSTWLSGRALPATVRWVDNQRSRWGSCTPVDRSIRLSRRLQDMPDWVVDYVMVHELAHLIEAGHNDRSGRGWPLSHAERAKAWLDGYSAGARLEPGGGDVKAGSRERGSARASPARGPAAPPAATSAPRATRRWPVRRHPAERPRRYRTSRWSARPCPGRTPPRARRGGPARGGRESRDAGLLGRLARRGGEERVVAGLPVPTEVEPPSSPAVQVQQYGVQPGGQHERARRQVARRARTPSPSACCSGGRRTGHGAWPGPATAGSTTGAR